MYNFFIDGQLLPVAPDKLDVKIKNTNKTMDLINQGEINFLKTPGLTEFSFTVLLPNSKYPFANYINGYKPASHFLNLFADLKTKRKAFGFIVSREMPNGTVLYKTNETVSLEEYTIVEDSRNGFDISVQLRLKTYKEYRLKSVPIVAAAPVVSIRKRETTAPVRPTPAPAKTYTVKRGDTLWGICKRFLGNGSRYPEIAKLNGIKNPNLIYPGQVIRLV